MYTTNKNRDPRANKLRDYRKWEHKTESWKEIAKSGNGMKGFSTHPFGGKSSRGGMRRKAEMWAQAYERPTQEERVHEIRHNAAYDAKKLAGYGFEPGAFSNSAYNAAQGEILIAATNGRVYIMSQHRSIHNPRLAAAILWLRKTAKAYCPGNHSYWQWKSRQADLLQRRSA